MHKGDDDDDDDDDDVDYNNNIIVCVIQCRSQVRSSCVRHVVITAYRTLKLAVWSWFEIS